QSSDKQDVEKNLNASDASLFEHSYSSSQNKDNLSKESDKEEKLVHNIQKSEDDFAKEFLDSLIMTEDSYFEVDEESESLHKNSTPLSVRKSGNLPDEVDDIPDDKSISAADFIEFEADESISSSENRNNQNLIQSRSRALISSEDDQFNSSLLSFIEKDTQEDESLIQINTQPYVEKILDTHNKKPFKSKIREAKQNAKKSKIYDYNLPIYSQFPGTLEESYNGDDSFLTKDSEIVIAEEKKPNIEVKCIFSDEDQQNAAEKSFIEINKRNIISNKSSEDENNSFDQSLSLDENILKEIDSPIKRDQESINIEDRNKVIFIDKKESLSSNPLSIN
ncbi:MAG: hypothetical protein MHPSP_000238, partial [Paramarteilia canceri]